MAASRLLCTVAACVIHCPFATGQSGHRKSYRGGRIKVAIGCDSGLSADFLNFGMMIIILKFPLKSASKSSFFPLWRRPRSGFGAAISDAVAHSSCALQLSLYRSHCKMAASRLLCTVAACVILLSFAVWTS